MLAVDGSRVSSAFAAAAVMAALFVALFLVVAVVIGTAAVRSLRGDPARPGRRSGAFAGLALAALFAVGAGQTGWSLARFGFGQWSAQRADRARASLAQRCETRWLELGPGPEGYPADATPNGRPPVRDRSANSVWKDDWLRRCRDTAVGGD